MNDRAVRPRPTLSLARAFGAQLRLLVAGRRRGLLIGLGIALAQVVVLAGWGYVFGVDVEIGDEGAKFQFNHVSELQEGLGFPLDEGEAAIAGTFLGILVFALFWPFRVWRNEMPSRRDYHWAMPVARRDHDLARVAAGAVGLVAIASMLYAAAALTALAAGHPGVRALSPWLWLGLLLGPLIPYVLSSVFLVRCEHPAGWLWGLIVLLVALCLVDAGRGGATGGVSYLVTGRFGLGWGAAGGVLGEWLPPPAGFGWLLTWAAWLAGLAGAVMAAAAGRSR